MYRGNWIRGHDGRSRMYLYDGGDLTFVYLRQCDEWFYGGGLTQLACSENRSTISAHFLTPETAEMPHADSAS